MIRIRLLGETSVRVGRTPIKPVSTVQFALVVYLAATAGAPVERARLLELFWPHMDAEGARHALRQMLYRLRRAGLAFEETGGSLRVASTAVEADFVDALAPDWGERAGEGELAGATRFLTETPLLQVPDFLAWLDDVRARIAAAARRALLARIAEARREGRWTRVEELARLCLTVDPLNEEATLARAEALAMSGAKSSALRTLDTYVEDLGDHAHAIALPARVLRERIAENFTYIRNVPQAWQRYVGRAAELVRCHAVIDEAVAGTGNICLVSGPSGIGKSRLAQEMLSVAKLRGFSNTSMRLEPRDRERPLALFTELVPALLQLPGAAACAPESMRILTEFDRAEDAARAAELALDAPVIRERIRRSIVDVVGAVCDEAPLIVLVDDAHQLDGTSVSMMRTLMDTAAGRRVVWLLCGQGLDRIEWAGTLPGSPVVLRLAGLTPDECTALASTFFPGSGVADAEAVLTSCHRATRGNPLFVKEWMREWQAYGAIPSVPDPIREALEKRVRALSAEAARVLQACCLLGPLATPSTLGEVLELEMVVALAAIDEIDAADLFAGHPSNPLEIHEVTGGVVRELMSAAHVRVLQYRIGRSLEARATSAWAPRMAWAAAGHLHAAGEGERAVGLLRTCARHLITRGEWRDAITTLATAVTLAPSSLPREELAAELVDALLRFGQYEEALRVATAELLAAQHKVGDDPAAILELELLKIEARRFLDADGQAIIAELLAYARRPELSRRLLLRATKALAIVADHTCDEKTLSEVDSILRRRIAEPPMDDVDYLFTSAVLAFAKSDHHRALTVCERALRIETKRNACLPVIMLRYALTVPLLQLGRTDDAIANLADAYAQEVSLHIWAVVSRLADRMSAIYFNKNERDESVKWLLTAIETVNKTEDRSSVRSILNQQIKSDAHFGTSTISAQEVVAYSKCALVDSNVRRKTEDLGAILHYFIRHRHTDLIPSIEASLRHSAVAAASWMDLSYAASALIASHNSVPFGMPRAQRDFVQLPLRLRSRGPEHWCLLAARTGRFDSLYRGREAIEL